MGIGLSIVASAVMSSMTVAEFRSISTSVITASASTWIVDALAFTQQEYSSATVSWSILPEYTDYTLQWSKYNDFSNFNSTQVSGNSYTVNNLEPSTNYYFRIKAISAPQNSGWSSTVVLRTADPKLSINSPTDIIAFDERGELWNYGPTGSDTSIRRSIAPAGTPIPVDFHVVDWNGDQILDIVMNTEDGMLNLWRGLPDGGFTVGNIGFGGWNEYRISIGAWKNGDKYPSMVAMYPKSGVLYNYPNPTGAGHGVKTLVGTGWTGIGISLVDYDRDGNMDILGKYPSGELKLFRSKGNSEFIDEARPVIATNWQTMDSLRIVYGVDGPDTRGIVSREISTGDLFYTPIGVSSVGDSRKINSGFTGYKLAGN